MARRRAWRLLRAAIGKGVWLNSACTAESVRRLLGYGWTRADREGHEGGRW